MQPNLLELEYAFDEAKHPRKGEGDPEGGQFAPKGGAAEAESAPALEFESELPLSTGAENALLLDSGVAALRLGQLPHAVASPLAAAVRQKVADVADAMGVVTRQKGIEVAALLDAETGQIVGKVLEGTRDSVQLQKHIMAMEPGRSYVQIHTHPEWASFSGPDIAAFINLPVLSRMVVRSEDRATHVLEKTAATKRYGDFELRSPMSDWEEMRLEEIDAGLAFFQEKGLTDAEVAKGHGHPVVRERWRAVTRTIAKAVADKWGLAYRVIEPGQAVKELAVSGAARRYMYAARLVPVGWRIAWMEKLAPWRAYAFDESKHPRKGKGDPEGGRFAPSGLGERATGEAERGAPAKALPQLTVVPSRQRAWSGAAVALRGRISKQRLGDLAEGVAVGWLRRQGFRDAAPLNINRNNFPLDLIQDHEVIEVKAGLASNGPSAQQWRATIGEPGAREKAWLAGAAPDAVARWNARKQAAILRRKESAARAIERRLGRKLKRSTLTLIVNPDAKTADLYKFDGFHARVGWGSEQARAAYVGSVRFAGQYAAEDSLFEPEWPEDEASVGGADDVSADVVEEFQASLDVETRDWLRAVLARLGQADAAGQDDAALVARLHAYAWDEAKHPREPAGSGEGGQFAPAGGDGKISFGKNPGYADGEKRFFDPERAAGQKVTGGDAEHILGRAAYFDHETSELVGTHVTSDPSAVLDLLRDREDLATGREGGKYGDIGPGLYMSDAPEIWMGRAVKKWSFTEGLADQERQRIAAELERRVTEQRQSKYISAGESEYGLRIIRQWADKSLDTAPIQIADQPFNIAWWKPDFLRPLGVTPGQQPQQVEMRVRGKFLDVTTFPELRAFTPETIATLREAGYDGAYEKGGFAGNPQLVVWNTGAVTQFGDYRKTRHANGRIEWKVYALTRQPSAYERKVDFARIERALDALERDAVAALRARILTFQAKLADLIRRRHGAGLLDQKLVQSLEVRADLVPPMRAILGAAFREGQQAAEAELARATADHAERQAWRRYAAVLAKVQAYSAIDDAAREAEPPKSPEQAEAGNYRKGHATLMGLDVSIENEAGSRRRPEWPPLRSHYGYFVGHVGKDKDHIDVFIRPGTTPEWDGPVFVVNQTKDDGTFDEHKVMVGWPDAASARAGYLENYDSGQERNVRSIAAFDVKGFLDWLKRAPKGRPAEVRRYAEDTDLHIDAAMGALAAAAGQPRPRLPRRLPLRVRRKVARLFAEDGGCGCNGAKACFGCFVTDGGMAPWEARLFGPWLARHPEWPHAARWRSYAWDESEHPRDDAGRFAVKDIELVGDAEAFQYGEHEPEDAESYYHVTTERAAKRILREGLRSGKPTMAPGAFRTTSRGKVFVTDRRGVAFWRDRIAEHLEAQYDDPPKLVVVRLPRRAVEVGEDANREPTDRNSWVLKAVKKEYQAAGHEPLVFGPTGRLGVWREVNGVRTFVPVQVGVGEEVGAAIARAVATATGRATGAAAIPLATAGVTAVGLPPAAALQWFEDSALLWKNALDSQLMAGIQQTLMNSLRMGLGTEETVAQLRDAFAPYVGSLTDEEDVTPYRLETMVRTNTTAAFTAGRKAQFAQSEQDGFIVAYQFSAIIDTRTTPVCRYLDGRLFLPGSDAYHRLSPPRQWSCRSLWSPVTRLEITAEEATANQITAAQVARGVELSGAGFAEGQLPRTYAFDESEHPREPAGSEEGGQFAPAGGEPPARSKGETIRTDFGEDLPVPSVAKKMGGFSPAARRTLTIAMARSPHVFRKEWSGNLGGFWRLPKSKGLGGEYHPDSNVIALTDDADPTTLLHEFGHHVQMGSGAIGPTTQQRLVEMWRARVASTAVKMRAWKATSRFAEEAALVVAGKRKGVGSWDEAHRAGVSVSGLGAYSLKDVHEYFAEGFGMFYAGAHHKKGTPESSSGGLYLRRKDPELFALLDELDRKGKLP